MIINNLIGKRKEIPFFKKKKKSESIPGKQNNWEQKTHILYVYFFERMYVIKPQ
jgi:hypothetical protein